MNIGVAKPSAPEFPEVPHNFISSPDIQDKVTADGFDKQPPRKMEQLFRQHDTVIMTGGTGLYIKAFCEGLDNIPEPDPGIRQRIIKSYEERGIGWLQEKLREKDPLFSAKGEMQNPQRMMRALEVVESTGQSILSFRKGEKVKRDFNIIRIGLELPREELVLHINTRVDAMMKAGLLDEVKALLPFKQLNALQTVGYAELFDHLEGKMSLEKAVEQIKINTRQYAKRQMTWFKKDPAFRWFSPGEMNLIFEWVEERLSGQSPG